MQRIVSSASTFSYKFVLAPVWIAAAGHLTWRILVDPRHSVMHGVNGGVTPAQQRMLLAAFIISSAAILWAAGRYKRVAILPTGLIVSNYFSATRVPFEYILDVKQRQARPYEIAVTFAAATRFGRRIVFLPKAHWQRKAASDDEIVNELRRRAVVASSFRSIDGAATRRDSRRP